MNHTLISSMRLYIPNFPTAPSFCLFVFFLESFPKRLHLEKYHKTETKLTRHATCIANVGAQLTWRYFNFCLYVARSTIRTMLTGVAGMCKARTGRRMQDETARGAKGKQWCKLAHFKVFKTNHAFLFFSSTTTMSMKTTLLKTNPNKPAILKQDKKLVCNSDLWPGSTHTHTQQ